MALKLPTPVLVILVGPSGSGKTTWASAHFEPNEVVSSDALRAAVGAGEDDQSAGTVAFDLLEQIVVQRMRRRLTTVIDTTGLNTEDRIRWCRLAVEANVEAHAVFFATAPAVCEQRNSARTRPIPLSVLRKQFKRFETAVGELGKEPFQGVHEERTAAEVAPQMVANAPLLSDGESRGHHTFGLILNRFSWEEGIRADQLSVVARSAEEAGFRDLWLMDHFRQIPQLGRAWEDLLEPYTTLGFIAGQTSRIRLGVLVSAVTHRHPVVLGQMVATLDVVSGGRAICGLGVGWDRSEHEGYGMEFPTTNERYDRLVDTLEMLPLLWGKGAPSFKGRVFSAKELICYPRPIQERIPIMIGGSGEKRTLRLVAEHGDACNLFGDPKAVVGKLEVLDRHCADVGRDRSNIEVSHLMTALAASGRDSLRERVDRLRPRNTSLAQYGARHNAGLVEDVAGLVGRYHESGATHTIVSIPDVWSEGSIEAFGDVISAFG